MPTGAYYTRLLQTGSLPLRVMVLNTNLYVKYNNATLGEQDPAGQYAWMRNVLIAARKNREKVFQLTNFRMHAFWVLCNINVIHN